MIADIVLSHQNEQEFATMAKRLGYDTLILLSENHGKTNTQINTQNRAEINCIPLTILEPNVFLKKKWFTPVCVQSSESDRAVAERGCSMMWGFEFLQHKDFTHQRGSGLNHVLCEIAQQKNIVIAFSLQHAITAKNPGIILGRMAQNIRLCQKYKVPVMIGSFARTPQEMRSPKDLQALFMELGLRPEFLKKNCDFT